jgi:hypothetical protein
MLRNISKEGEMQIETTINHKSKIRIHTLSGAFEFDVLFSTLEDIYMDPEFDPELNSIWDMTALAGLQLITPEELKKLVAYVSKERSQYGALKTALVVSKKIDFGIARVYELSMKSDSNNEVMVFKDRAKAEEWILER